VGGLRAESSWAAPGPGCDVGGRALIITAHSWTVITFNDSMALIALDFPTVEGRRARGRGQKEARRER
jgi:hypothetical protein